MQMNVISIIRHKRRMIHRQLKIFSKFSNFTVEHANYFKQPQTKNKMQMNAMML